MMSALILIFSFDLFLCILVACSQSLLNRKSGPFQHPVKARAIFAVNVTLILLHLMLLREFLYLKYFYYN